MAVTTQQHLFLIDVPQILTCTVTFVLRPRARPLGMSAV